MRAITKFTIFLILGFMVTMLGGQTGSETVVTPSDQPGGGKLLGIHHWALNEGIDPAEFERFIVEEYNPVLADRYPGVHLMVMKGERGNQVGNYIVVFEISSVYVRDFYWPEAGKQSDAAIAIWNDCGDMCPDMWKRLSEMATRTEWCDYVALMK